ncbi:hypothetical protein LINGRAHAP2_LOCUS3496, partial [Linum grandiflorum]
SKLPTYNSANTTKLLCLDKFPKLVNKQKAHKISNLKTHTLWASPKKESTTKTPKGNSLFGHRPLESKSKHDSVFNTDFYRFKKPPNPFFFPSQLHSPDLTRR